MTSDTDDITPALVVFLDFDGVTHPHPAAGAHFDEQCLQRLDAVLAEHQAQVVIISSWRDEMSEADMVERLGPVGRHVIGTAPEEPVFDKRPREYVVKAWLRTHDYRGPFVVIDDNPSWYGVFEGRVVGTDPATGFTYADVQRFRDLVEAVSSPSWRPETRFLATGQ